MKRREFQLVEGTAKKFWAIELNDKSHVVSFGRIGTAGQTQTKTFGSVDEAKRACEKLISEKVKKGYTEVAAAAPEVPAGRPTKKKKANEPEPAATVPAPPEAAPPAPPVLTTVTRVIELDPEDHIWATWRKREVLKKPAPQPFDFEASRGRLKQLRKGKYNWVNWGPAAIAQHLSREEAHFWLLAMTANYETLGPPDVAERMKEKDVTGTVTVADALKRIKNARRLQPVNAIPVLFNLFDGPEVVELMGQITDLGNTGNHWQSGTIILTEFARTVFPYLTAADVAKIRDDLRGKIDPKDWPTDFYKRPPVVFFLAALVGMHDELLKVVRSIPDTHYVATGWDHSYYHQVQRVVFGLGDAALVEAEVRRLNLSIRQAEFIRAWLALTEFAALDYVRDNILAEDNREACEKLVQEFARVKAPEAAPFMLELKIQSKAPAAAREWLSEQVGNAVTGLVPLAAGRGKLAEAAVEYLREAKKKGHEALIRAALKGAKAEVAESVRKNVLEHVEKEYQPLDIKSAPGDLKLALESAAKEKKGALPAWVDLESLPPVIVGDRQLAREQTTLLLQSLQKSRPGARNGFVTAVKEHADPNSCDTFAWKLFQLWQGEGCPSKEKWAMGVIGLLGGDGAALKITPLIRNWPGESQHARAVFGLECLKAIGSDTALMQLNGIAQKLKFKGLKEKATEAMEAIAKEKGLTRSQLEDRIVPDCDLDERGARVFDFGPRQFRFVLGAEMKPMVKDADGKVKPDLPKPGTKDDAAKAADAVAAWKLMKKQIKDVANIQAQRLEQAMVTGRRWPVADFQTLLVKHPLMINLVRLVLWGGYDPKGKLGAPFRVTEDQTLADAKDADYALKGVETVGIIHPLHLSEEQKAAWGEIFSDYEIVPPFPQLGRSIYRLEKGEEKETALTRFKSAKLPAPSLVFGLEKHGWVRGVGMDAGGFDEHSKQFPGGDVTAVVHYDGIVGFGYINPDELLSIDACHFVSGLRPPSGYARNEKALKLGSVDPVALSEVLSDLSALAAKGK